MSRCFFDLFVPKKEKIPVQFADNHAGLWPFIVDHPSSFFFRHFLCVCACVCVYVCVCVRVCAAKVQSNCQKLGRAEGEGKNELAERFQFFFWRTSRKTSSLEGGEIAGMIRWARILKTLRAVPSLVPYFA